jgi:aminoglycoside phosphotransferase (APT) family kinase protein
MQSVLTEAAHVTGDEQRRQVEQALRPRTMGPLLEQAIAAPRAQAAATECRILDVKYEPGDYCTVLYQLGERMVIGTISWGATDEDLPSAQHMIASLGMQIYLFEHDPALPGLEVARDPLALTHALNDALPECQSGAARVLCCRTTILRYRPGRRCTLRIDAWLRDIASGVRSQRTFFGKLYHTHAKAAPAYRELQLLAESAPARAGRVILARPAAFLPELLMILQEPVGGTPLDLLIGYVTGAAADGDPRGAAGIAQAGAALAAVHTAGLTAGRERVIATEVKRFGKRAARIAAVDPALGAQLGELATALAVGLAQLPGWGAEISVIHGDCKPNQFLIGPAGVAILDFDHCGMADPANDVGTFLATLRQLGIRHRLKQRGAATAVLRVRWLLAQEQQFLDAYCAASARAPEFRLRAAWYEAAALLRKALRAFGRSPRSPLPAALAEEAWRCLAELPASGRIAT